MLKIFRKYFAFCGKKNGRKFYQSIVLGVVMAMFEAVKIPAAALVIGDVLHQTVTMNTVWLSFGICLFSLLVIYVSRLFSTILQTEGGYGTAAQKRIEIAEHLRYVPMGYFNKNNLGQITSVATNAMESLGSIATRTVMLVTQGILTALLIAVSIFFFDFRIGFVVLAGLVLFFLVNACMQRVSQKQSPKKNEADTVLITKLLEFIQGIAEVKAYRLTKNANRDLNDAIAQNAHINAGLEALFAPYTTLQNCITKLTGVAMTICSVVFYLNGTMDLLVCIVMIISAFLIYDSLESAGTYSALLRMIDVNVDKAQEILDIPAMDIDGQDIEPQNYNMGVEHANFSYEDRTIIDDLSVQIPQNTVTAIVGPSGGGKTTLCHLLARFWDVDRGEIMLSGRNVKEYSTDSLMKNFSFVFQNVYLFRDTIANNIKFGNEDASMEKVIEAAKKACCHDFIMRLERGYDTVLGEGGSGLSGGERQRISIARAIMKDSPIIILDEATANVDPENEKELTAAIEALTKEKTVIMIAHRLKTVQHANCILVIDKGKIVQQGTHEELLAQNGIYANFIRVRKQAVGWKIT